GRRDREPEEREAALREDRQRDTDQRVGGGRQRQVGQDLAEDDLAVARAHRARRQHEVALRVGQRRGPQEAGNRRDRQDADRQDDVAELAGSEERHYGQREHERREGEQDVDAGHDQRLDPAAV